MHSSEGKNRWVRRWRYVMAPTSRPGIWRLKDGGYFVRVRVTDPRTGRRVQCARALRGVERDDLGRHPGPGPASTRGARARRGDDPVPAALERVRGIVVRGKGR